MTPAKRSALKAALAIMAIGTMLLSGCTTSPGPEPTPAIALSAIVEALEAVPGDNLTFILKVKSNEKVSDTVTLTVSSQPAEWRASLSNDSFTLSPGGSPGDTRGFFLTAAVPSEAAAGSYNLGVKAASSLNPGLTATRTVSVQLRKDFGDTIRNGTDVKVDYIGYLENFQVFDTSIREVGSDPSIPKAGSFRAPTDDLYQPLAFQAGAGQMIKGFDRGALGMGVSQSRTIRVEPADGYGAFESARMNLTESFPMYRETDPLNFTITYGEEAVPNKVVIEPYWGWKVQVVELNRDKVTLLTLPDINSTLHPYGWETRVMEVNGSADGGIGRITVRHYPSAGANVTYHLMKAEISQLTSDHVEITYNKNAANPLATQTLYFSVRIISID